MSVKLPPFQVLLDEHRVDVYRYLVATAGPTDADDVFQETFIAALLGSSEEAARRNVHEGLKRLKRELSR